MPTIAETKPETPSAPDPDELKTREKYKIPFDDSRVVKYGEPGSEVLRRVAAEIKFVDSSIRSLAEEMSDIMYRAHGVGLAAPQVGRSIRLLVYDAGDGLRTLINPMILKSKGEQFDPEEGCLSIPGLRGVVSRANDVTVRALDLNGRQSRFRATDFEARIILHEVDHLNGVLFIDLADPATLHMLTSEENDEDHGDINTGESSPVPPAE